MVVQVKKEEKKIVLTKPLSLEGESNSDTTYTAPNLLQRILSLFKNVRPGSDLTRFESRREFIYVVAWCISTTRPATFGVAPFNPILGETHHVSKGNLNVLLEQVLHS
ncbi:putative oxysterol-binding protein [Lupinus albus]|uniref:Putative oxysterol-binding protein n=1 Tax=Lupinus albus TaxID=3870 RepID=A0A6A4Q1X6_LUPAL|nr:putative oxysterol-binding protein [Lupinus albus]